MLDNDVEKGRRLTPCGPVWVTSRKGKEGSSVCEGGQGGSGQHIYDCWLLNLPPTSYCISGTDLLRQLYILPL